MQQRNGYGSISCLGDLRYDSPQISIVNRFLNGSVVQDPLVDFENVAAPHQWHRLIKVQIIRFVTLLPPDNDDVAETFRRDQSCRSSFSLYHGIRGDGGRM